MVVVSRPAVDKVKYFINPNELLSEKSSGPGFEPRGWSVPSRECKVGGCMTSKVFCKEHDTGGTICKYSLERDLASNR